jgi:hypothetical protein
MCGVRMRMSGVCVFTDARSCYYNEHATTYVRSFVTSALRYVVLVVYFVTDIHLYSVVHHKSLVYYVVITLRRHYPSPAKWCVVWWCAPPARPRRRPPSLRTTASYRSSFITHTRQGGFPRATVAHHGGELAIVPLPHLCSQPSWRRGAKPTTRQHGAGRTRILAPSGRQARSR